MEKRGYYSITSKNLCWMAQAVCDESRTYGLKWGKVRKSIPITIVDVLHSWTIPAFGVKVDACPGRLNQTNLFIKRFGIFFGQCSEICGVNHGFMPIVVLACSSEQFYSLILNNKSI